MHWQPHAPDVYNRTVFSSTANSFTDLIRDFSPPDVPFVLLLAADTSQIAGEALVDHAMELTRFGARYVCCWGPDCERLHDSFDEARLALEMSGEHPELHVMTTWHDDDSLEEALWFALNAALPSHDGSERPTRSLLAVAVGNPDWANAVRKYLSQ